MSLLSENQYKDKNTIPIFIILATIREYIKDQYEKISCKTFLLSWNHYIIKLLLYNCSRYIKKVM